MDHNPGCAVWRDEWPLALLWQGRWRLGRQRRLHCHQSDNRRINHRLQQQQQRLAGGRGIEWALAPNWSAKVEYNFLGLDDRTIIAPFGFISRAGDSFVDRNRDINMVKVGVNYRFNWGGYGRTLVGSAFGPWQPHG